MLPRLGLLRRQQECTRELHACGRQGTRDCESHRAGATQTGWITPFEKIIVPDVPAGRIGQPEDIAEAILLLASQQAHWINCATVFVEGGQGRSN